MEHFCCEASVSAGESVNGTAAAGVHEWLLLEARTPWGPKAPKDSGLHPTVEQALTQLAPKGGPLRVQLIRRPDRLRGPRRLYRVSQGRLYVRELDAAALRRWAAAPSFDEGWSELDEPVYLVCTHGKRDACCAKWGLPLYNAFEAAAPGRVWKTTHLGGHRFAPTFTALPSGLNYGRVSVESVPALVAGLEQGGLPEPGSLRGRCDLSRPAQVAFARLVEHLGGTLADPFALSLEDIAGDQQRWRLEGETPRRFVLDCVADTPLTLLASCADAGPKPVERWRVQNLVELPAL